jgi:integrase
LRRVFGDMPLDALLPQHVYKYVDKRGAPTAAKREVEILSHAFTMAVQWGDIPRHPFRREIELEGSPPRDRYVEDWEVVECFQLSSKRRKGSVLAVQAYIRLKLLTGMARGDLLRLEPAKQFKEDGIHVQRNKTKRSTGKRTIYEWTDELRKAVEMAMEARPNPDAKTLFCNRDGESYVDGDTGTAKGWDSLWQGFMTRVLKDTKVTVRFTEHDLRAKVASDADTLERARALMAHIDARLTQRIYRRKPERVRPMR